MDDSSNSQVTALTTQLQTASTSPTLRQQLKNLPQELYDKIYALSTTAFSPNIIFLTSCMVSFHRSPDCRGAKSMSNNALIFPIKPIPAMLHANRATRQAFAATYAGNGSVFISHDEGFLKKWLRSLAPAHRAMLQDVRLIMPHWTTPEPMPKQKTYQEIRVQLTAGGAEFRLQVQVGSVKEVIADL